MHFSSLAAHEALVSRFVALFGLLLALLLPWAARAQAPTIASFTPTSGTAGTSVALTGTNLSGPTAVCVNGTAGTVLGTPVPTATGFSFTVGAGSTSGAVTLATAGGVAASTLTPVLRLQAAGAGIYDRTVFLDQVELLNASGGLVTGGVANGSFEAGAPAGDFTNFPTTVTGWSFVGNGGNAALSTTASAYAPPAPPDGSAHLALLQIAGPYVEQALSLAAGTYRVRFQLAERQCCNGGPYDLGVQVSINGVALGATLTNTGAGYVQMVSAPFSVSGTGVFTASSPTLTGLSPRLGVPGTVLTLAGTDLTGATAVSFTGAAGVKTVTSGVTVASSTSITGIVVPAGAQSGPVTVTTANGTSAVGSVIFSRAKTLASGDFHTVAVPADGSLWAWGYNDDGQLGNGSRTRSYVPVRVGTGTNWASAVASSPHTVAVQTDGTLWAWGANNYGQLGDGTTSSSSVPLRIGTATNWVSASTGYFFTLAVRADGTLWAWGYNAGGQLGNGTTTNSSVPVQVGTATNWVSASAGAYHAMAVQADGTLWAWGPNYYGEQGVGNLNSSVPMQVGTATNWVSAAAGNYFTMALRADGTLWAMGQNNYGQLGDGTTTNRNVPVQVGTATSWVGAAAGGTHTAAMQADGTLWSWGANNAGQLGQGTTSGSLVPLRVGAATNWRSVTACRENTAGEQSCRAVWTWGNNFAGQLGDGTTTNRPSPVLAYAGSAGLVSFSPASALPGATVVATGANLSGLTALSVNGASALASVTNASDGGFSFVVPAAAAVLGTTTTTLTAGCGSASSTAFSVLIPPTLTALSPRLGVPGTVLTLTGTILTGARSISFTGAAGVKTVTTGFTVASSTSITGVIVPVGAQSGPITVTTANGTSAVGSVIFTRAKTLVAGAYHTVAVRSNGTLWTWGDNSSGQFGDNSSTNSSVPVQLTAASNWVSVVAGSYHTVALRADGTLWAWGQNVSGQLGINGTNSRSSVPVQVGTGTNWVSLAAGGFHTVAVQADGTLWAWGDNTAGQLGINSSTNSYVPVQVGTGTDWVSAAAGNSHTVALRTDGTLWTWGNNGYGQLGQGTYSSCTVPVQVGTGTNWMNPAAGLYHTVAVQADGSFWAWGLNQYGQLGNGTSTSVGGVPVRVGTATDWVSASAGDSHTTAEQSCRAIWAWGSNNAGQVGDGTTTQRNSPVLSFSYPMTLLSFSPASALPGATVMVTGTNLGSLSSLSVNGASALASVTNASDTGFSFVVPGTATAIGTTTAVSDCGTASSTAFTIPVPMLTAVNPRVGLPGTVLALTGINLTGASTVSFSGSAGSKTVSTGFTATATGITGIVVPAGAQSGPITVTTANGTSLVSSVFFTRAKTLAASAYHTVAVQANGSLWAWGANTSGQLGNGTTTDSSVPAQVGAATNWVSVSTPLNGSYFVGTCYTVAVRADGTLWAWGRNNDGQLGNGTTTDSSVPVQAGTATNWVSASAGDTHCVGVRADGTLWNWGFYAALGNGTTTNSNVPVQVGTATNWVSAAAGGYHTVALRADGTLWAWGYNAYGQLGDGTTTNSNVPVQVGAATNWVSVTAGVNYTVALQADGSLWAWGYNYTGVLGNGTTNRSSVPVRAGTGTNWTSAAAGSEHMAGLQADGTLWTWGYNVYGQLGDGTTTSSSVPLRVGTAMNWISAAAGNHTLGEQGCGAIWAWGNNAYGQLGDGTTTQRNSPVLGYNPVALLSFSPASALPGATVAVTGRGLSGLSSLSVNGANAFASVTNATATGFSFVVPAAATATGTTTASAGCGSATSTAFTVITMSSPTLSALSPRLGVPGTVLTLTGTDLTGATAVSFTGAAGVKTVTTGFTVTGNTSITGIVVPAGAQSGPITVTTANGTSAVVNGVFFSRAKILAAGGAHTVDIRADGSLWAWGRNNNGQLGNNSTTDSSVPVQVGTDKDWVSAAAGRFHTVAIRTDGSLWAWGHNTSGQLGDGGSTNSSVPVRVGTATNWVSAAAGDSYTIALQADGSLWAWGRNGSGELGLGTTTNSSLPLQVGTGRNWVSVATGLGHTVAVQADGTLWGWGYNAYGQLGNNSTTDSSVPLRVGTATNWAGVAAGYFFTVGVQADGSLWTMGQNNAGQLGDGTATNSRVPLRVGTSTSWLSAAGGGFHAAAVQADGSLWSWGQNTSGQLGNNATANSSAPLRVGTANSWVSAAGGEAQTAGEQSCRAIWAWGGNGYGQVGNGTITNRLTPVLVYGGGGTLVSFSPASALPGATVVVTGLGLSGLSSLSVNGANAFASVTNATATGFSFVVPAAATATGTTTASAGCGSASSTAFTVLLPPTLIGLSIASELSGLPVTLTGTNFASSTTVRFGGVAATNIVVTSATSLTASVPVNVGVGSAPVVVTTVAGSSAAIAFTVLEVYADGGLDVCATAVPATPSVNDGQWHYLLSAAGQVVAAYNYSGPSLGNFAVDVLRSNPGVSVRKDARNRYYLDRNFHLTASAGRFDGRAVGLRLYGLNTEFARLQAADPAVTLGKLKATQYSGPNEDCILANNALTGERRTLAAPATLPAGTAWFAAEMAVADHFSEFYLTGSSTPLPVELSAFTAMAEGNAAVRLAWTTASEKNSERFEVERSVDGTRFERLGTVAAAGSSSVPRSYALVDERLPAGAALLYYRLRQVDLDGTFSYSPVRTVALSKAATWTLYPNPAHGPVRVLGAPAGARLQVFDVVGRRIVAATAWADGTAELALPVGLAAGVYVVRLQAGNEVMSKRLVVGN